MTTASSGPGPFDASRGPRFPKAHGPEAQTASTAATPSASTPAATPPPSTGHDARDVQEFGPASAVEPAAPAPRSAEELARALARSDGIDYSENLRGFSRVAGQRLAQAFSVEGEPPVDPELMATLVQDFARLAFTPEDHAAALEKAWTSHFTRDELEELLEARPAQAKVFSGLSAEPIDRFSNWMGDMLVWSLGGDVPAPKLPEAPAHAAHEDVRTVAKTLFSPQRYQGELALIEQSVGVPVESLELAMPYDLAVDAQATLLAAYLPLGLLSQVADIHRSPSFQKVQRVMPSVQQVYAELSRQLESGAEGVMQALQARRAADPDTGYAEHARALLQDVSPSVWG